MQRLVSLLLLLLLLLLALLRKTICRFRLCLLERATKETLCLGLHTGSFPSFVPSPGLVEPSQARPLRSPSLQNLQLLLLLLLLLLLETSDLSSLLMMPMYHLCHSILLLLSNLRCPTTPSQSLHRGHHPSPSLHSAGNAFLRRSLLQHLLQGTMGGNGPLLGGGERGNLRSPPPTKHLLPKRTTFGYIFVSLTRP